MNATPQIGFIGLGTMGEAMAEHLLGAGFKVTGYDINPTAVERLVRAGGRAAASAAAAAERADLLILMVVSAAQVEGILFGDGRASEALAAGSVVWLSATVPPQYVQGLAPRLAARGIELIDGPVSGGAVGAAAGELTIMAAGAAEAMARASGPMAAVSKRIYRLGETPGTASTVKMINQLLTGCHIALAAEAMAFGIRMGANPEALYDVITNSAGSSRQFELKVPRMLAEDYAPRSSINIFLKDLGIVMETAAAAKFPVPIAAAAHQMFLMAAARGWGREGETSMMRLYTDFDEAPAEAGKPENR